MSIKQGFDLVNFKMPKEKSTQEDWEKNTPSKRRFAPWHLTSLAIILDITIILVYLLANLSRFYLLFIGYSALVAAIICIVFSGWLIKKSDKPFSLGTIRISETMIWTSIFITIPIAILTLALTFLIH